MVSVDPLLDKTLASLDPDGAEHLRNVADNLQLLADLGYADMALAVPDEEGRLVIVAEARPATASPTSATSSVGGLLDPGASPEAYGALESGASEAGDRATVTRGIRFLRTAYPVGREPVLGVIIRSVSEQVAEAPGRMETAFMDAAERLLDHLAREPLRDVTTGEPFVTFRKAGDGLLRIGAGSRVEYASPNAINIIRNTGFSGSVVGGPVQEVPGSSTAIIPAIKGAGCRREEVAIADRTLLFRTLSLTGGGAVVLIEDVTDVRRREQEIKIKEATIREVHHRVKNNLQTIASLLRIQARRAEDPRVDRALAEAVERIGAMAVVHEMLASSTEENVDFAQVAGTVVDLVRRSVVEEDSGVRVTVGGESGLVPAAAATSLALVVAELVHNALEHGLAGRSEGEVEVTVRRLDDELHVAVRDNGTGLPEGFSADESGRMGLAIVRTLVQDDLGGTLAFGGGRGTTVTIRVPLREEQ